MDVDVDVDGDSAGSNDGDGGNDGDGDADGWGREGVGDAGNLGPITTEDPVLDGVPFLEHISMPLKLT